MANTDLTADPGGTEMVKVLPRVRLLERDGPAGRRVGKVVEALCWAPLNGEWGLRLCHSLQRVAHRGCLFLKGGLDRLSHV